MDKGNPTVAPYAKLGECHLRITAKAGSEDAADKIIAPVEAEIRSRLGNAVYGINDETLELVCVRLLTERGQTVSTAESCTGGLLAGRITAISGSSAVFETGFITYANSAKQKLIGVSEETLEKYGAVSEETAREMALGAKSAAGSDYAVSVTGIAGPTGGTDEKPVGLVYIAVAKPDGNIAITKNQFPGRRNDVRNRAAHMALAQLREALIIV
jgi:nicotinamide-nucleotide amidase